MSDAIICHGCGAAVPVPEGHARNKMQCPECGVMCPVPPRSPAKKKAAAPPPAEDAALFEAEDAPPPTAIQAEAPAPARKGATNCPSCGELVRVPTPKGGRRGRCPACGADWPAPTARPRQAAAPARPLPPAPDEFAGASPDEDPETSNPYRTADAGARRCPGCSDMLGPDVVVCVRCGFDLRVGKKAVKEYQKLDRTWDSGMSLPTRIVVFLLCQAAAWAAILAGVLTLEDAPVEMATFGISWVVYTTLTAFLLGTYDRTNLKRSRSGRVEMVRAWRVAFVPLAPEKIDVRDYFGVVAGRGDGAGAFEWIVFVILLVSGVVPALVYWYCAIHQIVFYVALTNEHGNPEIKVYSGWSEEQMHQVRDALRTALTV